MRRVTGRFFFSFFRGIPGFTLLLVGPDQKRTIRHVERGSRTFRRLVLFLTPTAPLVVPRRSRDVRPVPRRAFGFARPVDLQCGAGP